MASRRGNAGTVAAAARGAAFALAALVLIALTAPAVQAQAAPAEPERATGHGSTANGVSRATPRETVAGFIAAGSDGQFQVAAQYLDLDALPASDRAGEGPRLARRLFLVMLRRAWIDPDAVSNDPRGSAEPGAEPRPERLAVIEIRKREVPILLAPRTDPSGAAVWLFSRGTVSQINFLYRAQGYGKVGDLLPSMFFSVSILGLQLWQWLALALALLAGYAVARLAAKVILAVLRSLAHRTAIAWDDALVRAMDGPLAIVLWGVALNSTAAWVGLPPNAVGFARVIWRLLTLLGVGWILFRGWGGFIDHMSQRGDERNRLTLGYVPILSRAGKFAIWVIIALAALDVMGINVVAMLAGIGIGGVAIAFAAQKTIENIFGAITIAGDRPFMVDDYVTAGGITGTVEEIGLRSTRIRTLDRTLVTVPNGLLATGTIVNFTQRDRFLFNPSLGVRYESTTDQLTFIIDEVRKVLIASPHVFQEYHRVRFGSFGAYSLNIDVFCWIIAKDYGEFTIHAEELNFAIAGIVERSGTSFAFPSQTLYLGRDAEPAAQRAEEIAHEVAARRERGELAVPEPPPGLAEKLRG